MLTLGMLEARVGIEPASSMRSMQVADSKIRSICSIIQFRPFIVRQSYTEIQNPGSVPAHFVSRTVLMPWPPAAPPAPRVRHCPPVYSTLIWRVIASLCLRLLEPHTKAEAVRLRARSRCHVPLVWNASFVVRPSAHRAAPPSKGTRSLPASLQSTYTSTSTATTRPRSIQRRP